MTFEFAKQVVYTCNGVKVVVMDSISLVEAADAGALVVCGSHGGDSAGEYAARYPLLGAFFNDAGIGKDKAGVLGVQNLGSIGVIAGAVGHNSARIGEGLDVWGNGVLTFLNAPAVDAGFALGQPLEDAIKGFLARRA